MEDGPDDVVVSAKRRSSQGGWQSTLACNMRRDILKKHEFFRDRNPEFLSSIIDDVDVAFFKPGEQILQQGDKATQCYILNQGEVSVDVDGTVVATLREGSIFGEICLLGLAQHRTASIFAVSFCDVLVVHQNRFQYALKSFPMERAYFQHEAKRRMAEIAKRDDKPDKPAEPRKSFKRSSSTRIALPKMQSQEVDRDGVILGKRGNQNNMQSVPSASLTHGYRAPNSARRRSAPIPSIVGNVLKKVDAKNRSAEHDKNLQFCNVSLSPAEFEMQFQIQERKCDKEMPSIGADEELLQDVNAIWPHGRRGSSSNVVKCTASAQHARRRSTGTMPLSEMEKQFPTFLHRSRSKHFEVTIGQEFVDKIASGSVAAAMFALPQVQQPPPRQSAGLEILKVVQDPRIATWVQ